MDIWSVPKRSEVMSRIGSKNTKPEIVLRKALFSRGFRYRIHVGKLPGKPDIVLPKYKTIIFVHGCFWHGHHGCRYAYTPKSNTDFWMGKIAANKARDLITERKLVELGWNVITVWECEMKPKVREKTINRVFGFLRQPVEKYRVVTYTLNEEENLLVAAEPEVFDAGVE